jgi:anti-anti-sigma factor
MAGSEPFQLSREDDGRVSFLALAGDADRFRAEAVTDALDDVRGDGRTAIVDVSRVSYMDSSMLSVLVGAAEQRRRRGEPFVIVCANERLRRSLRLKGLETILKLADDRDHALALIAGDGGDGG